MKPEKTYRIEPLTPSRHDRGEFNCGVEPLNESLQTRAAQDMKRRAAGCWVIAADANTHSILGYYTLSPEAVDLSALGAADAELLKKLPRYPRLGAVLLGRLAVAKSAQGQGLGELLLLDAMSRVLRSEIPAILMLTDPKDERAEGFYRKFGFGRLNPDRMFTTMPRIAALLGSAD
ncbi:MAG: GNAT family N-acetyltransferase [Verrucomicrobiales bacterium]